jgi:hypothetical protein
MLVRSERSQREEDDSAPPVIGLPRLATPVLPAAFRQRQCQRLSAEWPHLEINDGIELWAGDIEVPPNRTETMLCASESYFAYFDWQLAIWMPTRCAIDQQCRAIFSVSSDNARPPAPPARSWSGSRRSGDTLVARVLRCGAMSAALVIIVVVALLCVGLLALFGLLWAALHFGAGEDDND